MKQSLIIASLLIAYSVQAQHGWSTARMPNQYNQTQRYQYYNPAPVNHGFANLSQQKVSTSGVFRPTPDAEIIRFNQQMAAQRVAMERYWATRTNQINAPEQPRQTPDTEKAWKQYLALASTTNKVVSPRLVDNGATVIRRTTTTIQVTIVPDQFASQMPNIYTPPISYGTTDWGRHTP